jgi:hypothetical protein
MAEDQRKPAAPPDDPDGRTHPQDEAAYQANRTWNPPSTRDTAQAAEGRDVPPVDEVERGDRDPGDPWMGGG